MARDSSRSLRTFDLSWTRFREANGKIIHIQSVRPKDHPEFTFFDKPYSLLDNSPAVEFVEELKPYPNEIVVKKYSHDCFYQTTMEEQLKKLDLRPCRDHVVVTGIGSNNCVYHAVIGFHIRNYWVHVPEDCIHASRSRRPAICPESIPFARV